MSCKVIEDTDLTVCMSIGFPEPICAAVQVKTTSMHVYMYVYKYTDCIFKLGSYITYLEGVGDSTGLKGINFIM